MSKVTAPLLGFGAQGQIGKTQVYASWRGVKYARRYAIPSNPNTDSQQATRGVFAWINQVWKLLDPAAQAPWTAFAKGKPFTDRNAIIKANLPGLRGTDMAPATTLAAGVFSPGVNGGLALTSAVSVDATGHDITCTVTPPALPSGWSWVKGHAIAFKQQNANTDTFYSSVYGDDDSNPAVITLAMGAAGTYAIFAFGEYLKPDGSTAYSPSKYQQLVVA